MAMDQSSTIMAEIAAIKLLSTSASNLLAVATKEDHDMQEIVNIVKNDAPLTAKTLKVVNSAAFGLRNEITDLDRAVSFTGEDVLMGIAMSEAASMIYESDLAGYNGQKGDLWRHNLFTSLAAKEIAKFAKEKISPGTAFTCGLLHDFGKAITSNHLVDTPAKIIKSIGLGKMNDYAEAEKVILGMDHCEVGAALATHWQLPEPLPVVMRYHHNPSQAPVELATMVFVVHLGDMIAMMNGAGTGADDLQYHLDNRYEDYIALSPGDIENLTINVLDEFNKIQESFTESV